MNISLQNIDKVSALLTLKIEKSDYQEQVEKSLKSLRQKVQMPGFRKGMVPMSLVKKMYEKSVMGEEINKIISDKLFAYIKDNNINMLGEPLPNEEKQAAIDFDTMEEFEFLFDIALAPEFTVEATNKDKVPYYNIDVTDEMVDSQIKNYTQRSGNYEKVDTYQDKDMLKGLIAELDENGSTKEGGIQVEGAVIMPAYMKNDDQKALFNDAKVNDVIVFNPFNAFNGHEAEIASLLHVEKEQVAELKSDFSYQVEEITRFVDGELNQDIFDQVFGEGTVKTEEEFRNKIKEAVASQFVADSDYRFLLDAREMLETKVGKLEFPDALLKRVMLLNNEDKGESFVDENYEKSLEELTWHLIKEKLVKEYEIKVEQEDVINMAKEATRAQFAQYGMMTVPDDILDNYAKEMLKKKESVDGLVNRAVESKLAGALKAKVKLQDKTVSLDEFNKLFEEK
ncbi:trigger factor [Bacteroides sp. 519]|uniref:trigger factor n=1 Tax=Bacteroides sp. 519 TaxID=2302937 RepID=UPI0013D47927|nr:trigger factor [Bacteroides sp. 519]NDV59941.1 trigger factor [Bacteroides sp. 519]